MRSSHIMESKLFGDGRWRIHLPSVAFPAFAFALALIVGGVMGRLTPSALTFIIGSVLIVTIIALRQDQLAVTVMILVHVYVDWYLGLLVIGQAMALGLLILFYLSRSTRHLWAEPHMLWLWIVFLGLGIFPAFAGNTSLHDLLYYYPNMIWGAFILFWLGTVIARDTTHLHTLFSMLAGLGALLAIVSIVQATTGVVLFGSSRYDVFLSQVSNFELAQSNVHRAASFLINPDWNGTFFCVLLFLPLSLFVKSSSPMGKLLYLCELLLVLLALLFTYSVGAWVGAIGGAIAFTLFVGRTLYRLLIPVLIGTIMLAVLVLFPNESHLLLQHASGPTELLLRQGAWQTGIEVIKAFPLTGVGLSLSNYLVQAEPYRSVNQYIPLAHPHNSYLELGAMGGIPLMLVFLLLLFSALWQVGRNWLRLDAQARSLLAGGIAAIVTLSVNSMSINGWTLPPLAAIGWLILGAIASPLLIQQTRTQ